MSYLNRFVLIANVSRLPERKQTIKWHEYTLFYVAQTKKWVTATGEKKETTNLFTLYVYAKIGDILLNSDISIGDLIYLEWEIIPYTYEVSGEKVFGTKLSVTNFSFCERKNNKSYLSTNKEKMDAMSDLEEDLQKINYTHTYD